MAAQTFEPALRREEVFDLRGATPHPVLAAPTHPRLYELALALVEAEQDGGAPNVATLCRALVSPPHPRQVRERLRELEATGFAVREGPDHWRAAPGVAQATPRADLRHARARLRAKLGYDERLGGWRGAKVDVVRAELAEIEAAFERENHAEVVRRVGGRVDDENAGSCSAYEAPRAKALSVVGTTSSAPSHFHANSH